MVTAVDTSVILDVLSDDPVFADASAAALLQARREGALILGETVLAEIIPALPSGSLAEFLADWQLGFRPSTQAAAELAGEMLRKHLSRGGKAARVVPDFLVGAHATLLAERLLTRDRGYYRDYFKRLRVWDVAR